MACETLGYKITWEEAENLTGFDKGFYTWPPKTVIELNKIFPGVKEWSDFNYSRWFSEHDEYFSEYYHHDTAWIQDQKAHASPNFNKEIKNAQEMITSGLLINKNLTIDDWRLLLNKNIIIAFVHFGLLHNIDNPSGHAVLVYAIDDRYITLHDPGLPPIPKARIPISQFFKAYRNLAIIIPTT